MSYLETEAGKDWWKELKQRDRDERYRNSWRLTVNGVVIDQVPVRLGEDFCKSLLGHFRDNIINALTVPGWLFNDKESAADWIRYQEDRVGVKLSVNVVIHPPGEWLPLWPNF